MEIYLAILNSTIGYILLLLIVLLFIVFLLILILRKPPAFPFEKVDSLMTKTELNFYNVLRTVIDEDLSLFSKVRMADIITVIKGSDSWRGHFNKIQAKHVDFLICDAETIEPLLIIELDDKSHERPDRIARDEFVDAAMDAADLEIIHIPVQDTYDQDELRRIIYDYLELAA